MVFSEDIKRVFKDKAQAAHGCEVTLSGGQLVVSGHKGLAALSSEEVVVRLKRGVLRVTGASLSVVRASPSEVYVSGAFRCLEFPEVQP